MKIPRIDTSEENLAYISGLKAGERVIEMGQSGMHGVKGTVYESENGAGTCVMWELPDGKMGTSVTWGTRRISDARDAIIKDLLDAHELVYINERWACVERAANRAKVIHAAIESEC